MGKDANVVTPVRAHAVLSASGSSMWLNCTGSRRMNEGKRDETSPFAFEGTIAHSLGEYCLKNDVFDVTTMVGVDMAEHDEDLIADAEKLGISTIIEYEMADYVQQYVDYVRSYAEGADLVLIEERVDYSPWVPDGFGTADAIIVKGDQVEVIDLKYGKGVAVSAFENTQGMLYGLGTINKLQGKYNLEDVTIHIFQPRLDNVSEYHVTKGQLLHWAEKVVRPKALEAMSDTAPLTPGEKQCLWCKAQGDCVPYAKYALSIAIEGFEFIEPDMDTKDLSRLTPEDYAVLLPQLKTVSKWTDAVESRAKELMLDEGVEIPGYKIVEGRSNRRWINEDTAAEKLKTKLTEKEMFSLKLISPTQAEKLLGKKDPLFNSLVEKPEGAPTIARESDKRPAINNRLAGFEFNETFEG